MDTWKDIDYSNVKHLSMEFYLFQDATLASNSHDGGAQYITFKLSESDFLREDLI